MWYKLKGVKECRVCLVGDAGILIKVTLVAETDKLQGLCNLIQWTFIKANGLEGVGRFYAVIQSPGLMEVLSSTCLPKSPRALTSSWSMDENGTGKMVWEVSTGQNQKWHKALLPTKLLLGKTPNYGLRKQRKQVMVSTGSRENKFGWTHTTLGHCSTFWSPKIHFTCPPHQQQTFPSPMETTQSPI